MENFRAGAIMIFCGEAKGGAEPDEGGNVTAFSKLVRNLTAPLSYGGTDVDLITGNRELSQHYSVRDVHFSQPR